MAGADQRSAATTAADAHTARRSRVLCREARIGESARTAPPGRSSARAGKNAVGAAALAAGSARFSPTCARRRPAGADQRGAATLDVEELEARVGERGERWPRGARQGSPLRTRRARRRWLAGSAVLSSVRAARPRERSSAATAAETKSRRARCPFRFTPRPVATHERVDGARPPSA